MKAACAPCPVSAGNPSLGALPLGVCPPTPCSLLTHSCNRHLIVLLQGLYQPHEARLLKRHIVVSRGAGDNRAWRKEGGRAPGGPGLVSSSLPWENSGSGGESRMPHAQCRHGGYQVGGEDISSSRQFAPGTHQSCLQHRRNRRSDEWVNSAAVGSCNATVGCPRLSISLQLAVCLYLAVHIT